MILIQKWIGYFSGDKDSIAEPLLNIKATTTPNSNNQTSDASSGPTTNRTSNPGSQLNANGNGNATDTTGTTVGANTTGPTSGNNTNLNTNATTGPISTNNSTNNNANGTANNNGTLITIANGTTTTNTNTTAPSNMTNQNDNQTAKFKAASQTWYFIKKFQSAFPLNQPKGVAVDPNTGKIYVAITGGHNIRVFNPSGRFAPPWALKPWNRWTCRYCHRSGS